MRDYPFDASLTPEARRRASLSVGRLNAELMRRYLDAGGLRLFVWISDAHLHQVKGYGAEDVGKHLYRSLDAPFRTLVSTRRQLELALHEVSCLSVKPELVILGGDMVDYGFAGEYDQLSDVLETLDLPCIYFPGNHEHYAGRLPAAFLQGYRRMRRDNWPDCIDADGLYFRYRSASLDFICLDTLESWRPFSLPDRQRKWLKLQLRLSRARSPTVVCAHRHMLSVGNWVDECILRDKGVWSLIDRCPSVVAVVSGHVHAPRLWSYRSKLYATFPAVACGIGASTGWGGMVLNGRKAVDFFFKELCSEAVDETNFEVLHGQAGRYRFMEPETFERSVLLNPCYWPPRKES